MLSSSGRLIHSLSPLSYGPQMTSLDNTAFSPGQEVRSLHGSVFSGKLGLVFSGSALFLHQRIAIAVQKGNPPSDLGTFPTRRPHIMFYELVLRRMNAVFMWIFLICFPSLAWFCFCSLHFLVADLTLVTCASVIGSSNVYRMRRKRSTRFNLTTSSRPRPSTNCRWSPLPKENSRRKSPNKTLLPSGSLATFFRYSNLGRPHYGWRLGY